MILVPQNNVDVLHERVREQIKNEQNIKLDRTTEEEKQLSLEEFIYGASSVNE